MQLHILQFVYVLLGCSSETCLGQGCFVHVVDVVSPRPLQQLVVLLRGLFLFLVGFLFSLGRFLFLLLVCVIVQDDRYLLIF